MNKIKINHISNLNIAKSLFGENQYKKTIDICKKLISKDDPPVEALKLIAQSYLFISEIENARFFFNKFLNYEPKDYEVIKDLGNTYLTTGDTLKAKLFYEKAISINDSYAPALNNLGSIELNMGNMKDALSLLLKATKSDSKLSHSWGNLATCYFELKENQKAESAIRKAISINPDSSNFYYILANTLIAQKKLSEAESSLRKAIQINPNLFVAHSNLGSLLGQLGRLNEAEISVRKAIELNPEYADAHANLGCILQRLGKLEESKYSSKKAVEISPDWKKYFLYASSLFENNEFTVAIENLQKARSLVNKHELCVVDAAIKKTDMEIKKTNCSSSSKVIDNKEFNKQILYKPVEKELIAYLYKLNNKLLNDTNTEDARYGNGFCSTNFQLFEDSSLIIKNLARDLINTCKKELELEEIIIYDSFFNIFVSGCGAKPHYHIGEIDMNFKLYLHKYSLVYYLDVGDQEGGNPGLLRLYEPEEEILPANGMVVIIDSNRYHSVSYSGNKNRVMIGINLYGF